MLASSDEGRHEYEDIELSHAGQSKMLTALARAASRGKSTVPPPPPVRTVSFGKTTSTTGDHKRHPDQHGQKRVESPKVEHVWATKMSQFESALQQFQSKYKKKEKRKSKQEERKEKEDDHDESEFLVTKQGNAMGLVTGIKGKGVLHSSVSASASDRSCEHNAVQTKESTLTPLTPHQARVQKSLENLNVPAWFRPSPGPSEGAPATPRWKREKSNRPGWRRESSTLSISSTPEYGARTSITSHEFSTRSSPCPSYKSYNSGKSYRQTQPNYLKDRSLPPPPATQHTYKQPYLGWRSQEQLNTPGYLQTPAQRLAHSSIRQNGKTAAPAQDFSNTGTRERNRIQRKKPPGLPPSSSLASHPAGLEAAWVKPSAQQ